MLVGEWGDGTRIIAPPVQFCDLSEGDKEKVVWTYEKLSLRSLELARIANSIHQIRATTEFARVVNHKMNLFWYITGQTLHAHTYYVQPGKFTRV